MDIVRVGTDLYTVSEDKTTYDVKDLMSLTALNLAIDMSDYRKGKKELSQQIELGTNTVTALVKAVEALK